MIKVLTIVPYKIFPAKVGGQKGIALFNEYFSHECELLCITVKSNDPRYAKGYKVLNILPDAAFRYINPLLFFSIKKLIRQQNITHLILEHPYFGWLGILLKKYAGIKLIIHSHNIENTRWKSLGKWWWRILWWYERAAHRQADYNFFIHNTDKEYALNEFRLSNSKCITVTYGIETERPPTPQEKDICRLLLQKQHNIAPGDSIFLFNGALDYKPNFDAVKRILDLINPYLLHTGFLYKIIICGRGLPKEMNELKEYADRNIIYAGFVDDITVYFKGADVFINPVVDGGGIKTKLVEAIGYATRSVSTENGSIGVEQEQTNGQLIIVADNAWKEFAQQMKNAAAQPRQNTPPLFYQQFYWGNITRKAALFIQAGA